MGPQPGRLLPQGFGTWQSRGLSPGTVLVPGDCLDRWCSDSGDMTPSLDAGRSDPRPHADGENVAVTREEQIAPNLVCPSLLRTTECPCGEAFWAHSVFLGLHGKGCALATG